MRTLKARHEHKRVREEDEAERQALDAQYRERCREAGLYVRKVAMTLAALRGGGAGGGVGVGAGEGGAGVHVWEGGITVVTIEQHEQATNRPW